MSTNLQENRANHDLQNQLFSLMSCIRAFEADLRADAHDPDAVRRATDEYVPAMLDMVRRVARSAVARPFQAGQDDR
jgi:hypothetical protein